MILPDNLQTQSRWCTAGCYTITVKRHSILESTMWYEPTDVLCHLKELIYNIKACATCQINQQRIFPENLQHIILAMYLESYWAFYSNRQNTLGVPRDTNVQKFCAIQRGTFVISKRVQRTAKLTDRCHFLIICNTQSWWCILWVTGYFTVTVTVHPVIESAPWNESAEVLCHLKKRVHDIKACATYSQIDQQMIFTENLQHIILAMYLESYWLFYCSRKNTFGDWEYLDIWMYRSVSSVPFKGAHS